MNLSTWRIQFPEFVNVPDVKCQAALDAASLEVDIPEWTGQELGGADTMSGWCGVCGWSACSGCTAQAPTVITNGAGQTKADQGQAYLAAHKLALSPWGMNARLVPKSGTTTYWTSYYGLLLQVATPWICV